MYFRLSEIGEEAAISINQPRKRSNSLPIPHIEISLYQGPNSNNRDSPGSSINKDYIEIPEPSITACLAGKKTKTISDRSNLMVMLIFVLLFFRRGFSHRRATWQWKEETRQNVRFTCLRGDENVFEIGKEFGKSRARNRFSQWQETTATCSKIISIQETFTTQFH